MIEKIEWFIYKEKGAIEYFGFGFIASIIAYLSSLIIPNTGVLFSIFTAIFCYPLVYGVMKKEASRSEYSFYWEYFYKLPFIERHKMILSMLLFLTLGVSFGTSVLYLTIPNSNQIFSDQYNTIHALRKEVSLVAGSFINKNVFYSIFFSNVRVLIIFYLFSLVYGVGSLFLLTWQGTVLGVAAGLEAKKLQGVLSLPLTFLYYLPWGLLEFFAYICTSVGGCLLYIAIARHKGEKYMWYNLRDSILLLLSSIAILFIAGIIECLAIG